MLQVRSRHPDTCRVVVESRLYDPVVDGQQPPSSRGGPTSSRSGDFLDYEVPEVRMLAVMCAYLCCSGHCLAGSVQQLHLCTPDVLCAAGSPRTFMPTAGCFHAQELTRSPGVAGHDVAQPAQPGQRE